MSIRFGVVPVPRGQTVPLDIVQVGPVHLTSLRVNLVCEVLTRVEGVRKTSYPYRLNVLLPLEAEPSQQSDAHTVSWRLEIWGKRAKGVDFMRAFDVEVV